MEQNGMEQNGTKKTFAMNDAGASCSEPMKPKQITFDGSEWLGITEQDRKAWARAYPACNLDRQLAAAGEWAKANPAKAKKNWRRFLANWLSRQQERGGDVQAAPRSQPFTARIAPTPTMSRIGNWFHRRDDEPWAEEEAGLLASLNPPDDELDTMGRYYTDECVESSKRRQSVSALLRAWQTELDKARCWLTSQGELL
jgi:hypothetical protein